jgi:hypothetical protein
LRLVGFHLFFFPVATSFIGDRSTSLYDRFSFSPVASLVAAAEL